MRKIMIDSSAVKGQVTQIQDLLQQFQEKMDLPSPTAKNLLCALENFSNTLNQSSKASMNPFINKSWSEKQLQQGMETALKSLSLFQANQNDKSGLCQKNVHQALVSLIFCKLSKEVDTFRKNLRMLKDLKEWKHGAKIEKIGRLNKRMRDQTKDDSLF